LKSNTQYCTSFITTHHW